MSTGVDDPKSEQEELAAARREHARLLAEHAELKMRVADQRKALAAAEAEAARFRALYEQRRPNQPERVASVEQQLVLQGMPGAFSTQLAAANDVPALADPPTPADVPTSQRPPADCIPRQPPE